MYYGKGQYAHIGYFQDEACTIPRENSKAVMDKPIEIPDQKIDWKALEAAQKLKMQTIWK